MNQRRRYDGDDRQWEQWKVIDSNLAQDQQDMLLAVINFAHDLLEGKPEIEKYKSAVLHSMTHGHSAVWQNTANWIRKIGDRAPEATVVWDELAIHTSWEVRWRIACVTYYDIPEAHSNRLFARLRYDKSSKVREYAISRYENRPNPKYLEKVFDAAQFDDRVRRNEVTL
jgi:hypothetical protein